jgi:predicted Zn-dependent protease with MMP-like domain
MPRQISAAKGFSRGRKFFERLVREAVSSLPEELKNQLENVAVMIEENPPAQGTAREDPGEDLLGLYQGIMKKDRGFWYGNVLPDQIIIYRKPLERMSSSLDDLKENVRQTVVHEIGHYFGFDEEELQRLEEEYF